ncbi:hypothetical protein C7212DRAFT_219958, partial [Tuber magnatum]
ITAEAGNMSAVKVLLESANVDINAKDIRQRTLLARAIETGNLKVPIALIYDDQVDVNTRDMWDRTALQLTLWEKYADVVRVLLDRKDIEVNSWKRIHNSNREKT